MQDEKDYEYIEIIFQPNERVELAEFTKSLAAFNAEYRSWLREHPEFDHKDQDLRLFIERISAGSIKIWFTKSKELFNDTLEGFYKDFIADLWQSILDGTLDGAVPIRRLVNLNAILKWDFKASYHSKMRSIDIETSIMGDTREAVQNGIKQIVGETEIIQDERVSIKFTAFSKKTNARVVARKFSDKDVTAFLEKEVRDFFLNEDENFFRQEREYLVEMDVTKKQGEIEHYHIKKVLGS